MKEYKVSTSLKPYVNRILRQSFFYSTMREDTEGQAWCQTNAPSDTFHNVVQRAKCQRLSAEKGVLCMTSNEFNNPYMRHSIMRDAGKTSYCVIDDYDGRRRI